MTKGKKVCQNYNIEFLYLKELYYLQTRVLGEHA